MTEQEYINATNRVKVSAALTILRDILIIKDTPIACKEFSVIRRDLTVIEGKLFDSIKLEDSE